MNSNIKYFLVLFVLLIFSISCAYAVNDTDANNADDNTIITQNEVSTPANSVNKTITKTNNVNKTVKTATNQVTSYKDLEKELKNTEVDTVNIKKATYKATDAIKIWESKTSRKIVVNGNGAVIDGKNAKPFLTIYANNHVTINNLVIKNAKGTSGAGGIIVGRKASLTINNCNFTNDVSSAIGGAITNSGTLTVNNCVFTSNTAAQGGAIWSTGEHGGSLTIQNSKFINNRASRTNNYDKTGVVYYINQKNVKIQNNTFENNNGRAIHSFKSNSVVSGNTFKNIVLKAPTQTIRGAVIDNYESNIAITDNVFNNINIAAKSVKGGLLYNEIGKSSFEDNTVTNLKVTSTEKTDSLNGGIIFNRNSTFTVAYNTVSNTNTGYKVHGGELYNNMGKLFVYTNTFQPKNTASNDIRGGAIYNDPQGTVTHAGNDFTGIKNVGTVKDREIFNYGKVIKGTAPKKTTKLTLNKVTGEYADTVTITATVKDSNGKAVTTGNVVLKINNKAVTIKTNNNGVYSYTYKTTKVGTNTLTASYAANTKYKASTAKSTLTVTKRTTKLTLTKVAQKTYNDKITITGKLTDKTDAVIKNADVKVKLNAKTVTVKTNAKGVYSYKVAVDKVGKNNITVSYAATTNYKASSVKSTFNVVKRASNITVTKLAQKTYNDKITITGKLTDNSGVVIKNADVKVKLNAKTVTVKTNAKGVYSYNVAVDKVGKNNITVSYAATTNYKASSVKSTFNVVKRASNITVTQVAQKTYNDTVTITGKLTDNSGVVIKNADVKVKLNAKTVTVKTNAKGVYSYNVAVDKVGKNNITVSYAATANYKASTVKSTFDTVARPTKLTVDTIADATVNDTITITGKLTDNKGVVLKNNAIKITVNDEVATAKTNTDGVYTYTYTAITEGSNNVAVNFEGNTNYIATNAETTFTVA